MRGDLYNGWFDLCKDFTPSVNTADDPTKLKPFETPACYGADCRADGYLKTGSIITGSSKTVATKTIGDKTYLWHYNRAWRAGTAPESTSRFIYGATFYDDIYVPQGTGFVDVDAAIVKFMPVFGTDMLIMTASGSQLLSNANNRSGQFTLADLYPEAFIATVTHALTLNGTPFFSNSKGVFSWTGRELKEYTRPVRYNLGSFVGAALTADFSQRFIVGGTTYVIDVEAEKLFDYGTAGFLFTSRTLAGQNFQPFQIDAIAINLAFDSATQSTLNWQSKIEDNDWYDESVVNLNGDVGYKSRIELPVENGSRSGHKFAMRITSMPSTIRIRSIEVMVRNLAYEAPVE